jgi:hypothetical protein
MELWTAVGYRFSDDSLVRGVAVARLSAIHAGPRRGFLVAAVLLSLAFGATLAGRQEALSTKSATDATESARLIRRTDRAQLFSVILMMQFDPATLLLCLTYANGFSPATAPRSASLIGCQAD